MLLRWQIQIWMTRFLITIEDEGLYDIYFFGRLTAGFLYASYIQSGGLLEELAFYSPQIQSEVPWSGGREVERLTPFSL